MRPVLFTPIATLALATSGCSLFQDTEGMYFKAMHCTAFAEAYVAQLSQNSAGSDAAQLYGRYATDYRARMTELGEQDGRSAAQMQQDIGGFAESVAQYEPAGLAAAAEDCISIKQSEFM